MSYCGSCGRFYSPACPRAGEGTCCPAPNPYDEAHAAKLNLIAQANAKVAGMIADNAYCALHGTAPAHDARDFGTVIELLDMALPK